MTYLQVAVARSINDGALQLEGIHKWHKRGQPAKLDALIDLSHLKPERQKVSFKHEKNPQLSV